MLPRHCKDVALRRVDFPLTEASIRQNLLGRELFTRTDYIVLENGGERAVTGVRKKRGLGLFREVVGVEILSLPADTDYIEDGSCDVLNAQHMARCAASSSKGTVVVKGRFEHLSFVKGEKAPPVLKVVDFVPPRPSKTLEMVEAVLGAGLVERPFEVEPVLVDITERVRPRGGELVFFPCEAGRLSVGGRPVLYLDKAPPIPAGSRALLAGCRLSCRIFLHVYGFEPDLVNICPRELAGEVAGPGTLAVARCCDVHRIRVEGGLALLPYGVSVSEVAQALRALAEGRTVNV